MAHRTPPSARSNAGNGPVSSPQRTQPSRWGWKPSSESSFQKNPGVTTGDGDSDIVRSAPTSIRYSAGAGSRSCATWSTASSIETAWVSAA